MESFDAALGRRVTIQRTGVVLQLIHSGTIGAFDFPQLVLRFVEGLVLFGFAQFLTNVLALRFVRQAPVYHSCVVESFDEAQLRAAREEHRRRRAEAKAKGRVTESRWMSADDGHDALQSVRVDSSVVPDPSSREPKDQSSALSTRRVEDGAASQAPLRAAISDVGEAEVLPDTRPARGNVNHVAREAW